MSIFQSRMYDRLVREAKLTLPNDTQVVDASNVAKLVLPEQGGTPTLRGNIDELPPCVPMFAATFVEFRLPRPDLLNFTNQIGVLLTGDNKSVKAQVFGNHEIEGKTYIAKMVEDYQFTFTDEGRLNSTYYGGHKGALNDVFNPSEHAAGSMSHTGEQIQKSFVVLCNIALHVAFSTFAFAHCKNVSVQQRTPGAVAEKRWRKKYHQKLVKYYTLDIDSMAPVLQSEGGLSENGLSRAMHLCRGHFAVYSPDRPMFGRLHGQFWISPHVRGSDETRRVVKDYSVGPIPEKPATPSPYADVGATFPTGMQVVYFVQAQDGPIKIGYSTNLQQRMRGLEQHAPLTLLHAFPGDRECEQFIHRELAQHRLNREYFSPVPQVLALLDEAKRLDFKSIQEARARYVPRRLSA